MRLPPRRVLTPSGTTNKRKERDDPFERPKPITTKLPKSEKPIPRPGSEAITSSSNSSGGGKGVVEPTPSNHLLAGYLAHEYLTKGTLMGQPWAQPGEKLKGKEEEEENAGGDAAVAPCRRSAEERYAEVAGLLKGGGGSHLPGVVNPTQLGRFLHL
ncbi:hypothetical protein RIF29_20102 [Crotalaria pallida]|uniref:Uncharacterized protein n=1 Tax=Crotalaria pallida TaxID=3830 RepID=A0AAN9I4Q4_CROPI